MMGRVAWFLPALLLLSGCGQDWREFAPPDASFKVSFPGTPNESIRSLPLEPGKDVEIHEYIFERRDPDALFSVTTMTLPAVPDRGPELDQWFAVRRDRVVANVHGKLLEEQKKDTTGREWRIEVPNPTPQLMVIRLFVAGKRVYQVTVVMPRDKLKGEDAERFMSSFAFAPR